MASQITVSQVSPSLLERIVRDGFGLFRWILFALRFPQVRRVGYVRFGRGVELVFRGAGRWQIGRRQISGVVRISTVKVISFLAIEYL